MQNQQHSDNSNRNQPKSIVCRFQSVEKKADGTTYNLSNQLNIQQVDDSVSTQGRVQEIQKFLPRLPTMQQIDQAKQKLEALRTENKIVYNVVPAEPQEMDEGNGNASGAQSAALGGTGSGKQ